MLEYIPIILLMSSAELGTPTNNPVNWRTRASASQRSPRGQTGAATRRHPAERGGDDRQSPSAAEPAWPSAAVGDRAAAIAVTSEQDDQSDVRCRFGSTNCGMKAPNLSSAFGLPISTSKPCRKNPLAELADCRVARMPPRPNELPADPDQVGRAEQPEPIEPVAHGGDDRGLGDDQHEHHHGQAELTAGTLSRAGGACHEACCWRRSM